MPIPDFQTIMLPLLRLAGDGSNHTSSESIEYLAREFKLQQFELREMLPSGREARFANRVRWAIAYLKMAGLIQAADRGSFRVTPRGSGILESPPAKIDIKFLMRFPEFQAIRSSGRKEPTSKPATAVQTPEEALEGSYQKLREELAVELLQRVAACSPSFFERLVVDLLVAMGYGGSRRDAGRAVGQSGDGGIDGIIKEDKLGLDVLYIQAKRWQNTVGRPVVQAFAGSLEGQRARKGVLITTSQFSPDALDYVERIEKRIILIDGLQLANLMVEHGIGVAEVARYPVCKVDLDYFGDEQ